MTACALCGAGLIERGYPSRAKTRFTLPGMLRVAQRPKHCPNVACAWHAARLKSVAWQHLAPRYGVYGYDVIAQLGWVRQEQRQPFVAIHADLPGHVPISEAEVRYLYHQQYLPRWVCLERQQLARLSAGAAQTGLLLSLDGLAPEGGEPQLWGVRELQTGLTVRSGWLSQQDQATFRRLLQPIAAQGWQVRAILSDKQGGLEPAVAVVFPGISHAWCQLHSLNHAAEPVAAAVEQRKVTLRQDICDRVGPRIRQEAGLDAPGVLTVTGLLPSPLAPSGAGPAVTPVTTRPTPAEARDRIVTDLLRRVRDLLTLKVRPPFGLAGLEMYERLTEVVTCLDHLLDHQPEAQLTQRPAASPG